MIYLVKQGCLFLKKTHSEMFQSLFIQTLHLILQGPYHIETSPLICSMNQWTGFYMIGGSVMNELIF